MGCGESKHVVATTESLSTRKKLNSNSTKKLQNFDDNNIASTATLNDIVQDQVIADATGNGNGATKVEENTIIIDEPNKFLTLKLEMQEENKEIQVVNSDVSVCLNKADKFHDKEKDMEVDKSLSSQQASVENSALEIGEKEVNLVEGDDNDSNTVKEENIEDGSLGNKNEALQEVIAKSVPSTIEMSQPRIEQKAAETTPDNVEQQNIETTREVEHQEDVNKNLEVEQEDVEGKLEAKHKFVETMAKSKQQDEGTTPEVEQGDVEKTPKAEEEDVETAMQDEGIHTSED